MRKGGNVPEGDVNFRPTQARDSKAINDKLCSMIEKNLIYFNNHYQ